MKKRKRDSQPMDLSKSGADAMKSNYREALDMVLLEKSQAQLETEVAESEVLELQARIEDLKRKVVDLASAERSLKVLLGEEVEEQEAAPQPIIIPFVPGQPYILPNTVPNTGPYDNGGIWTAPYTSPSIPYVGDQTSGPWGGWSPNSPTITFESGNNKNDGHFFTTDVNVGDIGSTCVVTTAAVKDAMISGHMSWTSNGSMGGCAFQN